jgi:hypothetical protein
MHLGTFRYEQIAHDRESLVSPLSLSLDITRTKQDSETVATHDIVCAISAGLVYGT